MSRHCEWVSNWATESSISQAWRLRWRGPAYAFRATTDWRTRSWISTVRRLDAKLSDTITGIKSLLLKPVDPFFRKNHQTEIPIKVTGTRTAPDFGLDFHHKQEQSDSNPPQGSK